MGSTTRITGMYSGMDTDALIEEMITANKTPLNNYLREKTEVEWQRETLLDLNKELLDLQNIATDLQSEESFKVYTTQSTDSRIATATATKDALEGTYTIKTEQLARATTYTSSPVSNLAKVSSIKSTGKIKWNTDLTGKSFDMTVNGVTKTIKFEAGEADFSDKNEETVRKAFQDKLDDVFGANQVKVVALSAGTNIITGGYTLEFSCGENALQVPITVTSAEENDMLSLLKINSGENNVFDTSQSIYDFLGRNDGATEFSYTINGKTETISTQTTLTDFFKKITDADNDLSIKYDSLSDAVIIRRDSTGAGRNIEISDDFGLFSALGFDSGATYSEGQNAIVSITDPEGRERTGLELTSNSFTYEGVNFNLMKAAPNEEVSITVAKDVDTVFDNVVKFVDKYNEILGKLNELTNEKPNKDYDPLLDEERDELSDTQQEKWDKLAKQGILYRDSTLANAISSMRSAVTTTLSTTSEIKSLFQIGISTTAYSAVGNNNGKLVIDEEKLREAINNNMDEVAALFTSKPTNITGTVIDTDNTTIASGSSFKITVNGKEETITFDKDYDLSNADQRTEMLSNINSIMTNKFGAKNIVFALSSGRIVVNSQKGHSITLNSGVGTDALASLGLSDGAKFDGNANGFAIKISNIMSTVQENITNKAGSSSTSIDKSNLGERMRQLNDYISRQQDRLDRLEDRYYSQFAAMENALAQLESQSSYVASMLGGATA